MTPSPRPSGEKAGMRGFEVQDRRENCASSPRPSPPSGEEREKNGACVKLRPSGRDWTPFPRPDEAGCSEGQALSRNHAVEGCRQATRGCDAPVAADVGDASSPVNAWEPNGVLASSGDEGVVPSFGGEAPQPRTVATASFRLRAAAGRDKTVADPVRWHPASSSLDWWP